jgi:hypothetical protein
MRSSGSLQTILCACGNDRTIMRACQRMAASSEAETGSAIDNPANEKSPLDGGDSNCSASARQRYSRTGRMIG